MAAEPKRSCGDWSQPEPHKVANHLAQICTEWGPKSLSGMFLFNPILKTSPEVLKAILHKLNSECQLSSQNND